MMQGNNAQAIIDIRNCTAILNSAGNYWSIEDKERLEVMFFTGVGISEMSLELGRTERAVYQQIEKMGLYSRRNPLRRRHEGKPTTCSCPNCKVFPADCPRNTGCKVCQEGA